MIYSIDCNCWDTTSGDEDGIVFKGNCLFLMFGTWMTISFLVLLVCVYAHVLARLFAAMASLLLGSVGEFDPSSWTFTSYLERLDQFFVANDIGKCAADATAAVVQEAG